VLKKRKEIVARSRSQILKPRTQITLNVLLQAYGGAEITLTTGVEATVSQQSTDSVQKPCVNASYGKTRLRKTSSRNSCAVSLTILPMRTNWINYVLQNVLLQLVCAPTNTVAVREAVRSLPRLVTTQTTKQ
jgi:hypothetical protein